MQDFQLSKIEDEDIMKTATQSIFVYFQEIKKGEENSQKSIIINFLDQIHENVTSSNSSPKSKFYSLMILCEFTERNARTENKDERNSKIFAYLSNHKLLKYYSEIASTVDPQKKITEKGKNFFEQDKNLGNRYLKLILESIKFWAFKYPQQSKVLRPTTYKRTYEGLVENNVTFPMEYEFFLASAMLSKKDSTLEKPAEKVGSSKQIEQSTPGAPNLERSINHMYLKIEKYVNEALEDDDPSAIENQVRITHTLLQTEKQKFQDYAESVMSSNNEDINKKYFYVVQIMNVEEAAYAHISKRSDYRSYITEMKLESERVARNQDLPHKLAENMPNPYQTNQYNSNENIKYQTSERKEDERENVKRPSKINPNESLKAVSNYFNQIQSKSKSPISGFRKINDSLSQQKMNLIGKSTKRSVSPISKSKNLALSMNSLRESKIDPIFSNPPNLNPPFKKYEGKLIQESHLIKSMMRNLHKSQGVRRFKAANFRQKNPLFQNEHIQIGIKSESIYEEVHNFKALIKIEMFIGNITEEQIKNFSIQYKGDPNVLLYANPKIVNTVIVKGFQNKQDLMIVPLRAPFPLLTMKIRYQIKGQLQEHQIVLPNSVLKLADHKSIQKSQFLSGWNSAELIKTQDFKLCHNLPPDSFAKWLPLQSLTDYQRFATENSTTDYETFCQVEMLRMYQAVLKINVRPNLQVIIQVGILSQSEQAESFFTFYLQTLQQLLQKVE